MKLLRIFEILAVLFTLIGGVYVAMYVLDERHASKIALIEAEEDQSLREARLRQNELDRDIKRDAEARVYYKNKQMIGNFDKADKQRLDYLEENLERKYEEQRELSRVLSEIEK